MLPHSSDSHGSTIHRLGDELRLVAEAARDGIALFDLKGKRLYVNSAGMTFLTWPDKQGRSYLDAIHPEDRDRFRVEYERLIRTGESRRLEVRAIARDGGTRMVQSELTAVHDSAGAVVAILAICRDVTDERRDDVMRKLTLETIFEQAPIGICIKDRDGRFLSTNRQLRHMLGYDEAELSQLTAYDVTVPSDREIFRQALEALFAGRREQVELEKRMHRKSGETIWVAFRAAIVRPPLDAPPFTIELLEDITERKRVQEDLALREQLLSAIFEHAPIGIALTDMDARFIRANRRYQDLLGYTEPELRQMTGWDVTHTADREVNAILRDELFTGKRNDYTWEKRYVSRTGQVVWARNTVTLMRDANGAPRNAIALVEDVTEHRLAHEAARITADRLQALSHRLVDLQENERRDISRELHDRVGQTLTAMRINMELIRNRLARHDDAEIRALNDESLHHLESAFKAVENVMYELRPPMLEEFGPIPTLKWFSKKFSDRTGIRVEVRGDENRRCGADVELALFRIAQEALTNIARHAKATRAVIELSDIAGETVVTIEDNGVGLDEEANRFEKPGYGLITMRERAESVGGTFAVSSIKGEGTRITVKVPARR